MQRQAQSNCVRQLAAIIAEAVTIAGSNHGSERCLMTGRNIDVDYQSLDVLNGCMAHM